VAVVISVVTVMIPIALIAPLMGVAIPPTVVLVPAAVTLRIQIATSRFRLLTALAMMTDCLVQSRLGFLDAMLAFRMIVIRACVRCSAQEQYSRDSGNRGGRFPPAPETL
jgi:hypothetical protein